MDYSYESLAYVARLSFKDAHGLDALFECYQRLRVLDDQLRFVTHRLWGTGDQLYDYISTNTQLVQQARIDGKVVLVSTLKEPAKRGQVIELYSTRRIHHAFKDRRAWWEYVPFSPTEHARVAISYPIAREPEGISVSMSRGARAPSVLRPAMKELVTRIDAPTLGATYRVDWSW
jgi:hypothetical protein